jgi:hypothetical protein
MLTIRPVFALSIGRVTALLAQNGPNSSPAPKRGDGRADRIPLSSR